MIYYFVLFLIFGILVNVSAVKRCPTNTTLQSEGIDCQYCSNGRAAKLPPCPSINETKCYCNEGFIRLNRDSVRCVRSTDCPLKCDLNEIKLDCINVCPPTCYEPNRHPCYPYVCIKGCECKKGFIRRHDSGKCIAKNLCKNCTDPNMELIMHCSCVETCQNRDKPSDFCPQACLEKCVCKNGYLLNEETEKCVLKQNCPLQPPLPI